jgi:large repetitive protein
MTPVSPKKSDCSSRVASGSNPSLDTSQSASTCGSRIRAGAILVGAAMFCQTPSAILMGAEGDVHGPSADVSTGRWPDATNTGVPDGVTLLPSGGIVITKVGTVISGLDIHGTVHIKAADVTVENCQITSNGWAVVQIQPDVTGTVVRDCTINGTGSAPDGTGNQGIMGQGTFLRNNIYNVENGITLTGNNTVIQDNYIHDLNAGGSPHYDGIQIDGGISNLTIRHNTIINSHGAAGAIMIDNDFGAISNVTVDNNLLAGGSFTIYSDAKFNSNPIAGVSITNNHIASGQYGPTLFRGNSPTYTGNAYDGAVLLRALKQDKTREAQ